MANEKRHIGLFGVAGVIVATLLIVGFVFAGNILQVYGRGVLTIQVMDEPVKLEHLYLTIDWVRIQNEDETWVDLTLESNSEPFSFDLLTLQDQSATLSTTSIPVGRYTMIKMHVLSASTIKEGGSELTVPSDVLKVILTPSLDLANGEQTTVLVDLQPLDIDEIAISHSLNLRPVVKSVVS